MTFKIQIQANQQQFTANANETILEAALRQNIALPYGCRDGYCRHCKGKIIHGSIKYPKGQPIGLDSDNQAQGYDLFCQAVPQSDLVLDIEILPNFEVKTTPCKIAKFEQLAHDVMRLYLKLPNTQRLQFLAGQYIYFILKDGHKRAFSLANAPYNDEYLELHIRHVAGGKFTDYVFNQLNPKAILRIQGPYGSFYLRENNHQPIILMAGGTGFAPIKAILEHIFYLGLTQAIYLYWGVRSLQDLYLQDLPIQWQQQYQNFKFIPVLSEPKNDDNWQGKTAWVHQAVLADHPNLSNYHIYMGGPPIMISTAKPAFIAHQALEQHIFYDAFEYAKD